MLTNTNNRTEHLNRESKTEELVNYKKESSLCEMLNVIIERFLLSLYHRHLELNNRYSDEMKKYQRSLPTYLRNRLKKKIIDQLLMTNEAVDHGIIRLVKPINRACYSAKRSDLTELKKKECC